MKCYNGIKGVEIFYMISIPEKITTFRVPCLSGCRSKLEMFSRSHFIAFYCKQTLKILFPHKVKKKEEK